MDTTQHQHDILRQLEQVRSALEQEAEIANSNNNKNSTTLPHSPTATSSSSIHPSDNNKSKNPEIITIDQDMTPAIRNTSSHSNNNNNSLLVPHKDDSHVRHLKKENRFLKLGVLDQVASGGNNYLRANHLMVPVDVKNFAMSPPSGSPPDTWVQGEESVNFIPTLEIDFMPAIEKQLDGKKQILLESPTPPKKATETSTDQEVPEISFPSIVLEQCEPQWPLDSSRLYNISETIQRYCGSTTTSSSSSNNITLPSGRSSIPRTAYPKANLQQAISSSSHQLNNDES